MNSEISVEFVRLLFVVNTLSVFIHSDLFIHSFGFS